MEKRSSNYVATRSLYRASFREPAGDLHDVILSLKERRVATPMKGHPRGGEIPTFGETTTLSG
jgi:hypothetical protein